MMILKIQPSMKILMKIIKIWFNKSQEHVVARCQSTLNEENSFSMGTHQSVEVQLPQSEPMPNIESSSRDDIHATSPTHSGSRRSTHHEYDVVEDSSVAQKKSPTYWNVDVINEEAVVTQTRLRVQDVFVAPPSQLYFIML
ncbi:uncharacterized protein LOC109787734 [Cajanus cajan]|uniref:uncharacterized protein LOC109787734 n=1 Tax=Cajanus cajan TaxID=3821 RepID=UPI00098D7CBC|nr:uncharacterized protein LOC109787734 [Cajanus cajan]